jgi:hypothetical protein
MLTCLLVVMTMIFAAPPAARNLTGAWTFEWSPDFGGQHSNTHECRITQKEEALSIQCDEQAMKGRVHGKSVTFEHTTGLKNEITASYKATLDADGTVMTGTWHLSAGQTRSGQFHARRH